MGELSRTFSFVSNIFACIIHDFQDGTYHCAQDRRNRLLVRVRLHVSWLRLHTKIFSESTTLHRFADTDCWCPSVCMFYDSFSHFMEFSDGTILHRTAERDTWFAYVCMFPDHFSSTFSDGTTVFKIAETDFWFAYVCMFHDSRIHGIDTNTVHRMTETKSWFVYVSNVQYFKALSYRISLSFQIVRRESFSMRTEWFKVSLYRVLRRYHCAQESRERYLTRVGLRAQLLQVYRIDFLRYHEVQDNWDLFLVFR